MNDYEQALAQAALDNESQRKSVLLGILGALVGALVGSIPWMIAFRFNWFVGFLGALIGLSAMKGYELLRGPDGKVKIVVIVTISLIVVVLAQYMTTVFMVYRDAQVHRFPPTFLETMDMVNDFLRNSSDIRGDFLFDTGLGIIFALLGLSGIFKEKQEEEVVQETAIDHEQPSTTGSDDPNDLSDFDF